MKHGALPARLFAVRKGSPAYSELLPSSGGTTTKTPGFSRDNRPRRTALCNRLLVSSGLRPVISCASASVNVDGDRS